MSGQIVDEQVYPHVATGFADTSAFLRELTLKSMLVLAPKHVGGPKSNAQHQLEMSEKEGREVSIAEVFIKTHTRKDGTYVDEKAKRIGESYEQNLIQATHSDLDIDVPMASDGASQAPNPTREQLDDIFLKSTSFDARGNPYGLGSLSQVYKKGKKNPEVIPSSSSITVLVQKLNETESKLAEQVEHNKAQVSLMMKYLKEKDPALPEWVLTATAQGNINQDPNLKPSEGEDDIAS